LARVRHLRILRAFVAAARLVFQPYLASARRRRSTRQRGKASGGHSAKLRPVKYEARLRQVRKNAKTLRAARDEATKHRPGKPRGPKPEPT